MPKNKTILPKTYSEFLWKKGGSNPEHKKFIGKPCVSWSQVESFNSKTGFNTGLLGKYEYIQKYFLGYKFPDLGWGDFGSQVENYITERRNGDNFNEKEKQTLNKIKPLGVFQEEILIYLEELDTVVFGYLDDFTPPKNNKVELLRDYKTKSKSSKKDLHKPEKKQIEIYIIGLQQKGLEVQNAEYCIIERLGGYECMQGGGREVLKVGNEIWYESYNFTDKSIKETRKMLVRTIKEISSLYKTYLKIFKK